jgi:adenine-specific DNA-methyltransferase
MDKLKMQTANKADENFKKLAEMFPNAVTETIDENGEVVRAIDKDVLMQEINTKVVDGNEERYQFTWPDKKKSVLIANAPINKTLRPCREESVDFDNTENLYIEGDNLEVLKLLQETYLGKIKMIYIDPPYNTGNDFVYEDDFAQSTDEYLANSGQFDEDGNRLVKNLDSNGRFHTDWLNMIYPRLKLAKDLLTDDGVIFVSLDDNEVDNLKKICNEIYGEQNFVECLIWKKRATPPNDKNIGRIHEFILVYCKDINKLTLGLLPRDEKSISRYSNPDNDKRGPWVASDLSANGKGGRIVLSCVYPITNPANGKEYYPSEGRCWLFNREKMNEWIKEGRVAFRDNTGAPFLKRYLSEVRQGLTLPTIMTEFGYSQTSAAEADKIFGTKGVFEYAKPTTLLNPLVRVGTPNKDEYVLDFFSGSASTAHAVMQLNNEDGGHRKFIMVQLSEKTDSKSVAYKAGYKTICEIGKERIRRAGTKIKEEAGLDAQNLDIGFRVLKCDSSNMKDVYYNPAEYEVNMFSRLEDNIKEDRTPEDLLFQVMLDLGVLLSSEIEETTIAGKRVFNVEDNYLIACFDDNVTEDVITEIAKQKPYYFVMRDSSMANDSVATNFEQIFATYSPDTVRKVL